MVGLLIQLLWAWNFFLKRNEEKWVKRVSPDNFFNHKTFFFPFSPKFFIFSWLIEIFMRTFLVWSYNWGERLGLRKLHSELVYLKIKPIHFPFLHQQNPKINLENRNTFWPTTLQRKRKEGIRMHLNIHNLRNRQRGFPFLVWWRRRKNTLMCVCVLVICLSFDVFAVDF